MHTLLGLPIRGVQLWNIHSTRSSTDINFELSKDRAMISDHFSPGSKSCLEYWSHWASTGRDPRNQHLVPTPWASLLPQRASPHLGRGLETNSTRILTRNSRDFPSYQPTQFGISAAADSRNPECYPCKKKVILFFLKKVQGHDDSLHRGNIKWI